MEQEGTSLMEPTGAAPLRPTDLREIGPYRLLGRLGEGGMGTVFLARAPTGRFVALKVVKAEFANQEGFAARFHAEVENARRVASFCTAQVLDNGNTGDGRPYMVTEYIAGTPLSDQIGQYGALEPGPLHGVALGVAAALAAIHVAGLVHRDLKPANVILSLSGPRVIDFGIARALDRETGFTLSGELLGSPGWWAPEQVRGETVSPAADIFAWGCLVAYSGNGRHPFGRGDPITLASRVLNNPPDLGALPAPLNELVRRATAMEPHVRPTAQELLIALVGGSAPAATPAATAVDPPTLVATEMLGDYGWQPPQNVVDEPDITAAFTTPPPSDATGRSASVPGSGERGPSLPGSFGRVPGSPGPAGRTPGSSGSAGRSPSSPESAERAPSSPGSAERTPSLPGSAGRTPSLPGSTDRAPSSPGSAGRGPSLPGSFGKAPGSPGSGGPGSGGAAGDVDVHGAASAAGPGAGGAAGPAGAAGLMGGARPMGGAGTGGAAGSASAGAREQDLAGPARQDPSVEELARREEQAAKEELARWEVQSPFQEQGRARGLSRRGRASEEARPGERPTPFRPGALSGAATQPGERAVPGSPAGDEPDTIGSTRTAGTRWLLAAAAAVLAIVVTAGVLIVTSARETATTRANSTQAAASAGPDDVGRRFALGEDFDDPIVIVATRPTCGLREYAGKTATRGQLCVIRWTMVNPGGERKLLVQPVVSMVDDQGAEHDPAPVTLPAAILPGGRVDSAFVFDLAMYRKPAKLTATMLENGQQIEVAL